MKESERLIAAKSLIDSPEKWMQGGYCDAPENIEQSCKFCSIGAVFKVRGEGIYSRDINETSQYLVRTLPTNYRAAGGLAEYNDTHTHTEVIDMFNLAIQLAQSEGN